ncbi:hypothetical protein [Kaistia terrae]|uniref:Abortive infection protein-like C-terminal domain-containing protein n=1 Tax=Kaistia terrae TaxID=537017 RepID=A0ABW0Q1I4_9HYPH|nr:hypothetical protein [Kaistia terrae]MCX5578864.1 hypothetical protein [Kaistia terrae]
MNEEIPKGRRFSLLYVTQDSAASDSERLRNRLSKRFELSVGERSYEVGSFLERELGIELLRLGSDRYYLRWDDFRKVELRDLLDSVTLIGRSVRAQNQHLGAIYFREVSRIFEEERTAYRLDEDFGVHPSIDPAYEANLESAVRGLSSLGFNAARDYLQKADDELLPSGDTRQAIRSVFDAVENVFKQVFPKATSVNSKTIQNELRPHVERSHADGPEKRTALKNVEALTDWVDGCHNYRHEPGHQEPIPPQEGLAVLIVSQGIGYARWLAELSKKR